MPKIEQHISRYVDLRIDRSIQRAKKEFSAEMKRHTSALVEDINNRAKEIERVARHLPNEERIRAIFQEEMHPHVIEMDIYKGEVLVFRDEMRALRLDVNEHEGRITRFEGLQPA